MLEHNVVEEPTGQLGVLEFPADFDFEVRRVFYLRGIASGATRGAHAHRELTQVLACLNGSVDIDLDSGSETARIRLAADGGSLLLDGRAWRVMTNFSSDAVLMVLCDRDYAQDEVVRDHAEFLGLVGA